MKPTNYTFDWEEHIQQFKEYLLAEIGLSTYTIHVYSNMLRRAAKYFNQQGMIRNKQQFQKTFDEFIFMESKKRDAHKVSTEEGICKRFFQFIELNLDSAYLDSSYDGIEQFPNGKKYFSEDIALIDDYVEKENVTSGTRKGYISAVHHFNISSGMSLCDVIRIAKKEEDQQIPVRKRSLVKILDDYATTLAENVNPHTANTYFSKIKHLIKREIYYLPQSSTTLNWEKRCKNTLSVKGATFYDIPTREDIQKVLEQVDFKSKALLLFMSSSGCAKAETLSITVKMWCDALKREEYGDIKEKNPQKYLEGIQDRIDMIPSISMMRIKNGKKYVAFCSPKATYCINKVLMSRYKIRGNDKVFRMSASRVTVWFQRWNDQYFGGRRVGQYRFFRSHALRKYFATNMKLETEIVNVLEGRSRGQIEEIYIKINPKEIREQYIEHIPDIDIPVTFEENKEEEAPPEKLISLGPPRVVEEDNHENEDQQIQQEIPDTPSVPQSNTLGIDTQIYIELGKLQERVRRLEKLIDG